MKVFFAVLLAIFAILPMPVRADTATPLPYLSPVFGDNMVLQRDRPIPVWGWAAAGSRVTVTLDGSSAAAVANSEGKWTAKLPAHGAGGPYDVVVNGPQTLTLHNVLIGDVWICSGQSNMQFGIGNNNNAAQEIAQANYPEIRLYSLDDKLSLTPLLAAPAPQPDLSGQWSVCTPQTVATGGWNGFTAVGYFFGRHLYRDLHIPIGLIHTSWGGTIAEAWTSAEALKTMPDFRPAVAEVEAERSGIADYSQRMSDWWKKNDPGSATGLGWADPAFDSTSWPTMTLPTYWQVAGIPELKTFNGVVWFRKEVDIPADDVGKKLVLHLGPIDDRDTTWFNGVKLGGMDNYLLPRDYPIPVDQVQAGKNFIAVRVLDTGGSGGIWGKPEQMSLEIPGGQPISLAGAWEYKVSTPLAQTQPVPQMTDNNPNVATVLYNGMIAPLIPYGIKGAIWYQGESNAGRAYQYRTLLPTMIQDWRSRWGEGNFPFFIVQLANFTPTLPEPADSDWAELREAQEMTAQKLPKTGLAVAIDIGDANDIHPKDKQDVGDRLALAALAIAYGKKIEYSGPVYQSMKIEGSKIRLKFSHVGRGLMAKGEKLQGFAIAGSDKHFVWADAVIDGDTILVSSPQVTNPVSVRYAWATNPVCNLYNKAGLPAVPFRTDDWPGITVNNK